ncbi:nUDIX hydrolase [Eubacterium sp. CAG:786]|nr:nUDIX hydrolase [Eubacterium sp. CAG:786]
MENGNTNWSQSVTAVVIKDGKVLLARHTYGAGRGMLIVPGGYLNHGEMPREALVREYLEETGVLIEPKELIGMRFNTKDWYAAFRAEYVSGEAQSDHDENSEAIWLDVNEALAREDVPDLTKKLIQCAMGNGFAEIPYSGKNPPHELFGA